ncbi:MAG: RNA pseudouridine synthase [Planctomycetes bacterium]|nr:RNA pseudouridine synthase [Planctomycetota bacterium]MCP4772030.1 RNA pseudouridine synthase [Planctomycetota bacterium]MCP4860230.1 RNA pseudouridine synthase [Planctomycetota bacterium]
MTKLEVLHVDNHLIVVNKPACIPVVPDSSNDESLFDLAKAWIKREYDKPGEVFLGVVHRLDRPVSGVVVFARTSKGASRVSASWQKHDVQKTYVARSEGRLPGGSPRSGEWRMWLTKDHKRNVVRSGKTDKAKLAITKWRVIAEDDKGTSLELQPLTGRPHQLRVACAKAGLVLLGDLKYGADSPLSDRSIGLHASSLEFPHPTLRDRQRFCADAPYWLPR